MPERQFEDGWLELDGLRIHYTEWGSPTAEPVVLLHGLNVQCHTWDPIAAELADEYHVIAMDMRGHGDSGWSRAGYRVRSMARDVHGLIDALGLGPVNLVGHSAGVRVAIAVAGERPEMVRRLALSDAGPANSASGAVAMRDFIQATTNIRGFRNEDEARQFYLGFHPEWRQDFIDLHVQHQLRRNWAGKLVPKADPDVQWITGSVSLPDVTYLWEMSALLTMPTLLMVGRTSNVLDEQVVDRMLQTMPNSTVRWFDTGHYVPREAPEEFTEVLTKFLAND
ncbi:alpha/beta hydrolase [Rhodococcus sp. USK10]|uniref:Hydrolase, alpha/beta fold family functionally coupled to Phosphoribulokinase n=1 Tax=Rhodococcus wratislaviensis TaxID=44752 RepID=A0A402CLT3_RHOWR|nr:MULTISPECIES: alpha/beta hydrolase [Rhodococcus]QYB07148.1 alpha/beta hydrolase [Rhodococcus sp. USK10]GCE44610.1 Hydrolase, alpha/beta fold family functionally coupled to Phosphoribulokinase [Rhodococcus wratislaviensis]